jgi:hypothetical protein
MNALGIRWLALPAGLFLAACGGSADSAGNNMNGGSCTLTADTTPTATVNSTGCHVLSRDTSSCDAARKAQGISGYWLKFSCRVALSMTTSNGASVVEAKADGQPDYESMYFAPTNACYQSQPGGVHNPNTLAAQNYTIDFPLTTNTTSRSMMGVAVVGLAVNGVPIFGDFAAPGDDIFQEALSFDSCGGHPQNSSVYHYHGEPYSISYDDANFIGVMRDGYPIYGRKDADGSSPTLDTYGGHTGVTADSPTTPVYHYHLNLQTSTGTMTAGQMQWFLTKGAFRGTPAYCPAC